MKRALIAAAVAAAAVAGSPCAAAETPAPPETAEPVIRRVAVDGARSVPESVLAGVAGPAALNKRAGDAEAVRAAADAVADEYRRRGFPVARVVSTDTEADGTLRLTVAEGTVRRVVVRGNRKTRGDVIRTAMQTGPGDVYRADPVARDRDRLARLGVFEDVLIGPEPVDPGEAATGGGDTVGLVDVVVRVKERRTGNLAATLGYSDRTGVLGYVDLSETNFAGRAQRVSVQFQRVTFGRIDDPRRDDDNEARSAFRGSYFAPFIGKSRTAFGFDVYDQNTIFQPLFAGDDESLRTYEVRRGARARVGRALGRGLSLFASVRRDQVGYDDGFLRFADIDLKQPLSAAEMAGAAGTVGALGLELIADARDADENPRRGYRYSLSYENASGLFGGTHRFGQTVLDARQYLPLSSRKNSPVLALRVLGGTSSGTVPLPEQFWIGGYELLRGYDIYSVRGDRLLLASAEARFPVSPSVQGVLFVDAGNAWAPDENVGGLRTGVGVGLRFLSPIGPIRLDAAYGDDLKTYVSLGQAF